MTNNRKIELMQKAYEIHRHNVKMTRNIGCIHIAVTLPSAILFSVFARNPAYNSGILLAGAILTGAICCSSFVTIVLAYYKDGILKELLNERHIEIVKKIFDGNLWYCIHILDTDEYLRAEIIEEAINDEYNDN